MWKRMPDTIAGTESCSAPIIALKPTIPDFAQPPNVVWNRGAPMEVAITAERIIPEEKSAERNLSAGTGDPRTQAIKPAGSGSASGRKRTGARYFRRMLAMSTYWVSGENPHSEMTASFQTANSRT